MLVLRFMSVNNIRLDFVPYVVRNRCDTKGLQGAHHHSKPQADVEISHERRQTHQGPNTVK
jgi:hypothetical protein